MVVRNVERSETVKSLTAKCLQRKCSVSFLTFINHVEGWTPSVGESSPGFPHAPFRKYSSESM